MFWLVSADLNLSPNKKKTHILSNRRTGIIHYKESIRLTHLKSKGIRIRAMAIELYIKFINNKPLFNFYYNLIKKCHRNNNFN